MTVVFVPCLMVMLTISLQWRNWEFRMEEWSDFGIEYIHFDRQFFCALRYSNGGICCKKKSLNFKAPSPSCTPLNRLKIHFHRAQCQHSYMQTTIISFIRRFFALFFNYYYNYLVFFFFYFNHSNQNVEWKQHAVRSISDLDFASAITTSSVTRTLRQFRWLFGKSFQCKGNFVFTTFCFQFWNTKLCPK